jgi:hypothetical protein
MALSPQLLKEVGCHDERDMLRGCDKGGGGDSERHVSANPVVFISDVKLSQESAVHGS